MQCDLALLVTLQAALFHAKASSRSAFWFTSQQPQNTTQARRSRACLPCAWTIACLCLPGRFEADLTHILRAFYSADIGINTASSCDGPTCSVSELVAGSASISLTQAQPQSSQQPTACNVSTQPATVVIQIVLNIPNIHMTLMHTDIFCSNTLYVHTDPDRLPSFAE